MTTNAFVLDVYRESGFRISKDTSGGYGTENDLGPGFIPAILGKLLKHGLWWPPGNSLNLLSELIGAGFSARYVTRVQDIDAGTEFVFVSCSIVCIQTELEAIERVRAQFPRARVFAFGSVLYALSGLLAGKGVCVIKGEPEFLGQHSTLNPANLRLMHALGEIVCESGDVDRLTRPYWVNDPGCVTRNLIFGRLDRYLPVLATRGCPYSCFEYCVYPLQQGRKVRSVDPAKLAEDIHYMKKQTGAEKFVFRDPVFSINRNYTMSLIETLLRKGIKADFTIETHLKNLDEDILDAMLAVGIRTIKFGVESASPEVMNAVRRHSLVRDKQMEIVELMRKKRIRTVAMYILCQPTDNASTCRETIDYAVQLDTNLAQFSLFTPYPATPYYNKVKIITKNYEDFSQYRLVYQHDEFSPAQARSILGSAYTRFYWGKITRLPQ